ncbi:MAG: hypothetical protein U1E42_02015 [Rhodospirillales bacterium]
MSRVLLQYALPLLLPTLLYLLWWSVIGRKKAATAGGGGVLAQGPWFALSLCGGVLLTGSLVYVALVAGVDPNATGEERYVPPQVQDGRVVPGHFEAAGERNR